VSFLASRSIVLTTVRTSTFFKDKFSWGFIKCLFSVQFAVGGLGGSCTELGRCGEAARFYLAKLGVDGTAVDSIPLAFVCERGKLQSDRGVFPCTTVIRITQVTSSALVTCAVLACVCSMCQLYSMLTSHRERILQMRGGDWHPVPKSMRSMVSVFCFSQMRREFLCVKVVRAVAHTANAKALQADFPVELTNQFRSYSLAVLLPPFYPPIRSSLPPLLPPLPPLLPPYLPPSRV
jgi:hypothetical protein